MRLDHTVNDAHRLTFHYDQFQNRIGAPDWYGKPYSPNGSPNMIPGISTMLRHSWVVHRPDASVAAPFLVWLEPDQSDVAELRIRSRPTLGIAATAVAGGAHSRHFRWSTPRGSAASATSTAGTSARRTRSGSTSARCRGCAAVTRSRRASTSGSIPASSGSTSRCASTRRATSAAAPTRRPRLRRREAASRICCWAPRRLSNGIVERENYNHPYLAAVRPGSSSSVTPSLTLTYGLRYNVEPSWTEARTGSAFIDTDVSVADRRPGAPDSQPRRRPRASPANERQRIASRRSTGLATTSTRGSAPPGR